LLLLGILHAGNILMLPMIGRLLSLNRRLDEHELTAPAASAASTAPVGGGPGTAATLPAGTWILRIESGQSAVVTQEPPPTTPHQ
jgi:hypothetical protein